MSFAQGTPTVPTLINSSNCIVYGNTSSGTALTVQQLGAGAVMNVATSSGSSALFVSSTGQVGVGTAGPNGTAHVWNVAATGGPKLSIGDNTAFAPGGLHSIAALTSTLGAGNGNSIILGRTNATNDAFQMTFMNVAQGSTTNYLGFNAFGSSYTAALAITAGGNVGIGVTNPGNNVQIGSPPGPIYGNNPLSQSNVIIFGNSPSMPTYAGTGTMGGTLFVNSTNANASNVGASIALGGRGADFGGGQQHMTFARIQGTQALSTGAYAGDFVVETQSSGSLYERMRITTAGYVGIGTANPGFPLDVYQSVNGQSSIRITNANAGTAAAGSFAVGTNDSTNRGGLAVFNSTYTASAQYRASGTYVYCNGAGGVTLHAEGANNLFFATNSVERMRIDSSGNVGIGTASPACQLHLNGTGGNLTTMATFRQGANECMAVLNGDINAGWGSTGTVLYVSKINYSGRSINTAGTIATGGTDYAEYMTKAGDFTIMKGDIVGVNAQGLLTNVFTESVTFVVKSTNPSYLGGDVWGTEEALGMTKPKEVKEGEPGYTEYQTALAQFNAKLEEARVRVDRIAFSGQTPVNVTGATPGQYIVPVANGDGTISGQSVTNPTFEQYMASVGKVINILPDGRAHIIVKVV